MKVGVIGHVLPLRHPIQTAEGSPARCPLRGTVYRRYRAGCAAGVRLLDVDPFTSRERFAESYEILTKCLTEELFDYQGKFYNLKAVSVQPTVAEPLPDLDAGRLLRDHRVRLQSDTSPSPGYGTPPSSSRTPSNTTRRSPKSALVGKLVQSTALGRATSIDLRTAAEVLDQCGADRSTTRIQQAHSPSIGDLLNNWWDCQTVTDLFPLYRVPPAPEDAQHSLPRDDCPFSVAAYLRLWAVALNKGLPGFFPTDQPNSAWSRNDLVDRTAKQPSFRVGLRFGRQAPVQHGPLSEAPSSNSDPCAEPSMQVENGMASGLAETRDHLSTATNSWITTLRDLSRRTAS